MSIAKSSGVATVQTLLLQRGKAVHGYAPLRHNYPMVEPPCALRRPSLLRIPRIRIAHPQRERKMLAHLLVPCVQTNNNSGFGIIGN